uniref:Uncharacterized protein n=1 Tax=Avena sativa TaxID=4498 RepID=A0ACD5VUR4_AVESA
MPPPVPALPEEAVEDTALLEEILEQIFLRLPPDEPACLVRASLASKLWLALLTGPRFRSRYREHHGASPTFGFLKSSRWRATEPEEGYPAVPPFFSTTGFRARVPDDGWGHRNYAVVDCHHGRALLDERTVDSNLAVWDPMTGRRRELQKPAVLAYGSGKYAAAVLCAVSGCDHLACHEGPFRVVFFSRHKVDDDDLVVQVRVSSPETWDCSKRSSDFHRAEWSQPCPGVSIRTNGFIYPRPPVLVNDALHLMLVREGPAPDGVCYTQILTYDLRSNCLSLIDAPKHKIYASILVAMEDGSLGFAHLKELTLFIWSRHMGSDNFAAWTQRGVIDLKNLLSIENPRTYIRLLGSVEGSDIIFVSTDLGIYKINLKSLRQKKISNEEDVVSLIPYVSFYNPREKGETL